MHNDETTGPQAAVPVTETADATRPADTVPMPRQRLPRRAALVQLLDGKPVDDTEPKDAPRAPDAWLERRLRVFERQMSAMEARQDQVEKNARAAAAAAEEQIKSLQETVKTLEDRAVAAEAKAKTAANELRAALNEATLRIQTVEGVARAALAEHPAAAEHHDSAHVPVLPQSVSEPAQVEPESTATDVEPQTGEDDGDPAPLPDSPHAYLADVRKSVAAATAAAAAAEEATTIAKVSKVRSRLTRYLVGSVAVIVVFAAGAGMAFSQGVSDGRIDAVRHASHHRAARQASLPVEAWQLTRTPLDRLTAQARAGNPAAELAVGLRYLDGPSKDPSAAFRWIALAAIHGQPVAQFRLASLYTTGTGTPADPARALQWYEASALQGNRKAMHDLGVAYAEGLGTTRNPNEAVRWLSRAAGFGYVDSEFNLAVLYERGEGVPQSLLDAYKWYAVAGRQGDAESKQRIEALKTQLGPDDLAAAEHAAQAFRPVPYDAAANAL